MLNISLTEYEVQRLISAMQDTAFVTTEHTPVFNAVLLRLGPAIAEWEDQEPSRRNSTITLAITPDEAVTLRSVMAIAVKAQEMAIQSGATSLPEWKHSRVLAGMQSVIAKLDDIGTVE